MCWDLKKQKKEKTQPLALLTTAMSPQIFKKTNLLKINITNKK
jgi:hypothetical protein